METRREAELGLRGRATFCTFWFSPAHIGCLVHAAVSTHFNISVEQQLVRVQHHVFVLEFVPRQQFGGAVAELQVVASGELLLI